MSEAEKSGWVAPVKALRLALIAAPFELMTFERMLVAAD